MLDNKVKIILFLPPYHPRYIRSIESHPIYSKSFKEFLNYMNEISLEYSIPLLNYIHIDSIGIDSTDFIDAIHLDVNVGQTIVDKIILDLDL